MQPPDGDVADSLLARADDDIALVRASACADEISDAIVGFHAQQAAEKLLKAMLARRRVDHPFTHDLERLLELVEDTFGERPPDDKCLAALTPWAVEFRYGETESAEIDRSQALALLERLHAWVIASMGWGTGPES